MSAGSILSARYCSSTISSMLTRLPIAYEVVSYLPQAVDKVESERCSEPPIRPSPRCIIQCITHLVRGSSICLFSTARLPHVCNGLSDNLNQHGANGLDRPFRTRHGKNSGCNSFASLVFYCNPRLLTISQHSNCPLPDMKRQSRQCRTRLAAPRNQYSHSASPVTALLPSPPLSLRS